MNRRPPLSPPWSRIASALCAVGAIVLVAAPPAWAAELTLNVSIDVTTVTANPPTDSGLEYAGVGFDGTYFWVAKHSSATFSRIDTSGALVDTFDVAGLTGTRSLTFDGTNLWAGNATTTIYCLDPTTRALCSSGTTTVTAPLSARYVTWDPTADGGNGGFWIGNFDTDILQIDLSGNTLVTIPAAGLPSARYGAAFDNITDPGQPFLWLFYQGGTNSCELTAIDLPSGADRGSTQDLLASVPSLTSGLAGGAFLAPIASLPGGYSILGLIQGTPSNYLVGYEPAPVFPVQMSHFTVD